jgi:two-component system, sensor histidine kinase
MMMPTDTKARENGLAARRPLRTLIVDDHPATQRAMQLLLSSLDCVIDLADNGRDAVEAVRTGDYDVILMDVVMPWMDGRAATRRIREIRRPGTRPRIVGTSAESTAEQRSSCFAAGMDDFLSKPIDVDALVRILDEVALGVAQVG